MFQHARIKLTLWYLVIILCISLSFSFILYKGTTREVERFARIQRIRIEQRVPDPPPEDRNTPPPLHPLDQKLVNEIKLRILVSLGIINGLIALVAGGLSYFLAGKTLHPIKQMLEEQNRFISDASHELRTPLTSLKTSMEVYLREKNPSSAETKSLITGSIDEVNRLQSLSEGLLQMAQYEKPSNHMKKENISLPLIIKQAVKKILPLAKDRGIRVETEIEDTVIRGNRYALTDLFIIFLDNAVKYAYPSTAVRVKAKQEKNRTMVSVTNEGIGIEPKDLPHIFERFYRADKARLHKSAGGGYGLGLSIAQKIAKYHHAKIEINSTVNKTTEVRVIFFS